jgi:hypothetical protein
MFTKDTPYQEEVQNLIKSLNVLKRNNYRIVPKDSLGSWELNCQMKAEVILEELESSGKDVVWVDADAIFVNQPEFFDYMAKKNHFDICCYYLKSSYNDNELMSGTIYFKNTKKTIEVIEKWIELNSKNKEWDQRNLQKIIEQTKDVRIIPLPEAYIKVKGNRFQDPKIEPVIFHNQASRRFKGAVQKKKKRRK